MNRFVKAAWPWVVAVTMCVGGVLYVDRFMGRMQVGNSISLASVSTNPVRTALGIACTEDTLRAGMTHDDLELPPPESYATENYLRSVRTDVPSARQARITIVLEERSGSFSALWPGIRPGDTLVYEGRCGPGGMTWETGGTLDPRYLPRF